MPGITFFQSSQVDPRILLGLAIGFSLFIFVIVYGTYRYQRWRHYKVFKQEMKTLDLDPEQENTLGDMVRRYAMHEPVQILYSQRLFDDLACKEMRRILASAGSEEAKERFIDALYEIRTKTYNPSWLTDSSLLTGKAEAA